MKEPLESMKMVPAIEVMKIISRYTEFIREEEEAISLIRTLLIKINEINPTDSLSLIAFMHGTKIEEVAEMLGSAKDLSVSRALGEGFRSNPLPDLVNAAALLGISDLTWETESGRTD